MRRGRRIAGIILAVALLAAGLSQCVFLLRYPYFRRYAAQNGVSLREARKAWGHPDKDSEWAMGLAVEAALENWDKVSELAARDRTTEIGTYYYNLSNAMKGQLADRLMDYYQPFERGLFLPVGAHSTPFQIGCAGDVWFALGYMPLAERDAMLGMLFSPAHTGSRYLRRLAECNLVTGDLEAASKYLRILHNMRGNRQWARDRFPGHWDPAYQLRIAEKRNLLPQLDLVHGMDQAQIALRILLGTNHTNKMALDYLLCYDLLTKDLDAFVGDYDPSLTASHLYEEAMLIFLAAKGGMTEDNLNHYHISAATLARFNRFVSIYKRDNGSGRNLTQEFGKSYWYYFYFAVKNEKE
ncbi:MAG: hypothetical protein IJP77_09970 [Bacteroidales bacterium]|jgi:hypothetical protein|nr:hypothetical protein [Bacteroidales bacterium]